MRRRILVAILGTVTFALALTGLGTLGLDRISSRTQTERDLRAQAQGLADLLAPTATRSLLLRPAVARTLKGFKLQGIGFMYVNRLGQLIGTPPPGVDPAAVDVTRLEAGATLSGRHGSLVYAIAPSESPTGVVVIAVLTRQVAGEPRALEWLGLSAVVALLLGAVVALGVSRALTDPLRRAEAATHRIAAGDLSTRLPAPRAGATDELSDLARSINTMAEGLDRSRGLEQQFLLSVSHDLRTPLTSIRGYAEAITDGTATEPRDAAAVILSEARRLERLVRDLLDLARLDARQFSFHPQRLPVGEVVAEAAEGFRPAAEEAGLALLIDDDPTRAQASVDPDRLAQVVANLVENGLKYAHSGLRVTTHRQDDSVFVAVADDGPGVAPTDLPHLFERLYVSRHRPVRSESGSGLGLAIVRELVAAMGGAVTAESPTSADGGTRMIVRFPVATSEPTR